MKPVPPVPSERSESRGLWYRFCQLAAQWLAVTLFAFRIRGTSHVPSRGGVILACNHQSFLDPVLAALGLPRGVTFMARDTLFKFGPFRLLIESLGAFPVQRGTADLGAMKEALRRLRKGHMLLVFPEGTRTKDGSVGRMRGGIAMLADRAKVPVVPVLIQGAYQAWPRSQKLPRPSPISVSYGEPLPADVAGDPERVGPALEAALERMAAELRPIPFQVQKPAREAN